MYQGWRDENWLIKDRKEKQSSMGNRWKMENSVLKVKPRTMTPPRGSAVEHSCSACLRQGLREGAFVFYCCITSRHSRNERTPTCLLLWMHTGLESGPGVHGFSAQGLTRRKPWCQPETGTHLRLQAFQITVWWKNSFPCYCRTKAPSSFRFLN